MSRTLLNTSMLTLLGPASPTLASSSFSFVSTRKTQTFLTSPCVWSCAYLPRSASVSSLGLSLAKLVEAKGCALRRLFVTRSGPTKPKGSGHDRGWSSISEEAQVRLPTISRDNASTSPPWSDMTFETGTHYLNGHQS